MTPPNPTPPHGQDVNVCPIAAKVAAQVLERSMIGVAKYGATLARTDLTTSDWLNHLQQELLDAANYVERLKQKEHPPTPPTLDEEQLRRALKEVGECLVVGSISGQVDVQASLSRVETILSHITTLMRAASRVADYQPGLKSLLEVNEALREVLKASQKVNDELQRDFKQAEESRVNNLALYQSTLVERQELEKERDSLKKDRDCWIYNSNELQKAYNHLDRTGDHKELLERLGKHATAIFQLEQERDQLLARVKEMKEKVKEKVKEK